MASLAQNVKALREMTGAGPLDCKKALQEHDNDLEKAAEALRQKGLASAKKKLGKDRDMNEGLIEVYQHHDGSLAVMVEVNCETDFVARNEAFKKFAKNLTLHISSMNPKYVKRDDVPDTLIQAERETLMGMDDLEGKPDDIKAKIVEGRLDKWYKDIVLMEQEFLLDDSKNIQQLLEETIAELGEKMQISRFARFKIGEYGEDGDNTEDGDDGNA